MRISSTGLNKSQDLIAQYLFLWSVLSTLFFILKNLGVSPLAFESAQTLIGFLKPVWPVVADQFEEVKRLQWENAASLYALFCFISAPLELVLIGWFFYNYPRLDRAPKVMPDDWVIWALAVGGIIYVLFLDRVRSNPFRGWNFLVDSFGFYFFRQAFFFYALSFLIPMAILSIALRISRRNASDA